MTQQSSSSSSSSTSASIGTSASGRTQRAHNVYNPYKKKNSHSNMTPCTNSSQMSINTCSGSNPNKSTSTSTNNSNSNLNSNSPTSRERSFDTCSSHDDEKRPSKSYSSSSDDTSHTNHRDDNSETQRQFRNMQSRVSMVSTKDLDDALREYNQTITTTSTTTTTSDEGDNDGMNHGDSDVDLDVTTIDDNDHAAAADDVSMMNASFSFSAASHAMKQRKLLSKVTFEILQLHQLQQQQHEEKNEQQRQQQRQRQRQQQQTRHRQRHHGEDREDDEWSAYGYECRSLLMRGTVEDVMLDDYNHNEAAGAIASTCSSSSNSRTSLLLYQTVKAVHTLIVEEFVSMAKHDPRRGSNGGSGSGSRGGTSKGFGKTSSNKMRHKANLDLSVALGVDTSCWHIDRQEHHEEHDVHDPLQTDEDYEAMLDTIVGAMEFLNVVYGSCDSYFVHYCLNQKIVLKKEHNYNNLKNREGSHHHHHDHHHGADDGGEANVYYILDALYYFLNHTRTSVTGGGIGIGLTSEVQRNIFGHDGDIQMNMGEGLHDLSAILPNHNHNGGIPMTGDVHLNATNSNTGPSRTKVQMMSMALWAKALLCAEYVHNYGASLAILPEKGVDSLLGRGLGLRVHGHVAGGKGDVLNEKLEHVARYAIQGLALRSKASSSGSTVYRLRGGAALMSSQSDIGGIGSGNHASQSYQTSMENECFELACMSCLGVLCRVDVMNMEWLTKDGQQDLESGSCSTQNHRRSSNDVIGTRTPMEEILNSLHVDARQFEQVFDHNSSKDGKFRYVSSTLALSLSLCLQQSTIDSGIDSSRRRRGESPQKVSISSDMIQKIVNFVFQSDRNQDRAKSMAWGDIFHACATHVMIQLCLCRHHEVKKIVKSESLKDIIWRACFKEMCTTTSNLHTSTIGGMKINQIMHVLVHFNNSFGYSFRSVLNHIFEKERKIAALIKSLLWLGTNNPHDELAMNTWRELEEGPINLEDVMSNSIRGREMGWRIHHLCAIMDLFNTLLKSSTICSHFQKSLRDRQINGTLVQMLKDTESRSSMSKNGNSMDTRASQEPLSCCRRLNAATLLALQCTNSNEDNTSLKRILRRFATNTMDGHVNNDQGGCLGSGILKYSVNQSISQDLTRRALNFQALVSSLNDDDSLDVASSIFESATRRECGLREEVGYLEQYQQEIERLSTHCRDLMRERNHLANTLSTRTSLLEQKVVRAKKEAQTDAIEMVETHTEEKLRLKQKMNQYENDMNHIRAKYKAKSEENDHLRNELKEAQHKNLEYKDRIQALEEKLESKRKRLEESEKQHHKQEEHIQTLISKVDKLNSAFDESQSINTNMEKQNHDLLDENRDVKERLERSLIQLISLARAYESKEDEHHEDRRSLVDKCRIAEDGIEKEMGRFGRLEDKYSQLKDKYQALKEKYEVQKKNNTSVVSGRNTSTSTYSKKTSQRQPMGTLAFMNSIHDTSMRLDRNETQKDGHVHHPYPSSSSSYRKDKYDEHSYSRDSSYTHQNRKKTSKSSTGSSRGGSSSGRSGKNKFRIMK